MERQQYFEAQGHRFHNHTSVRHSGMHRCACATASRHHHEVHESSSGSSPRRSLASRCCSACSSCSLRHQISDGPLQLLDSSPHFIDTPDDRVRHGLEPLVLQTTKIHDGEMASMLDGCDRRKADQQSQWLARSPFAPEGSQPAHEILGNKNGKTHRRVHVHRSRRM